jgi:UDP-glucose 4-epimerase
LKRLLLTGGTGFVGRNILSKLEEKYIVHAPTRQQLNINNSANVEDYLKKGNYDIVVCAAIPTPFSNADHLENDPLLSGLLSFMNFYRLRNNVEKIFYFGSGAEFDKRNDISIVKEEDFGKCVPVDPYGFSKYIMNDYARTSENIYNLRLFGCYGPTDAERKFIAHCISCCLKKEPISIKQNCLFDYIFVEDIAPIILYMIDKEPVFHDYNVCSGSQVSLYDIASIVRKIMGTSNEIQILKKGLGLEYTASNERLKKEISGLRLTSLEDGIGLHIRSVMQR